MINTMSNTSWHSIPTHTNDVVKMIGQDTADHTPKAG